MKINTINDINNMGFTSGLTMKLALKEKLTIPQKQEKLLKYVYGVEANFKNNKSAAFANSVCVEIFNKLFRLVNKHFEFPPFITVYNRENLIEKYAAQNFCIPDTKEVLKKEYPFPGRSIFLENFHNLRYIDDNTELLYKNRQISSSHVLSPFIHEWLHSCHLDYIYTKYGYGGNCSFLRKLYPAKENKISGYDLLKELETKALTKNENEIVYDVLGEYSTHPHNQYLEIFSESWTKFICDSLHGANFVKNPIDILKATPQTFQNILQKVCMFK